MLAVQDAVGRPARQSARERSSTSGTPGRTRCSTWPVRTPRRMKPPRMMRRTTKRSFSTSILTIGRCGRLHRPDRRLASKNAKAPRGSRRAEARTSPDARSAPKASFWGSTSVNTAIKGYESASHTTQRAGTWHQQGTSTSAASPPSRVRPSRPTRLPKPGKPSRGRPQTVTIAGGLQSMYHAPVGCPDPGHLPNPGRSHSQRRLAQPQGSRSRDPTGTPISKARSRMRR